MRENIDGVVLNDGIINFLGGRNFIASSRTPVFVTGSSSGNHRADVAIADDAILPYNDPNELPFVVDYLMPQNNRRMYDTGMYPEQFLPYQYITERLDYVQTDGLSILGPYYRGE